MRTHSLKSGYVHGDSVRARIVKRGDGGKMAEVEILSLIYRTKKPVLAQVINKKGRNLLKVLPEQGNLEIWTEVPKQYTTGMILSIGFGLDDHIKIINVFGNEDDIDIEERLILFLAHVRTQFPNTVDSESKKLEKLYSEHGAYLTSENHRTDFRDWYTMTIDGADARDLDDAFSLRKEGENYVLAVHIADVAEYVSEKSEIDNEALLRGTSIYTPGKVIPMLPEILSNDLCSLHPGKPKLTLSCIMHINARGLVSHTEIVEGIIESQKKGIYEEIAQYEHQEIKASEDLSIKTIRLAFELYHILEKRRRKEGKITFESSEIAFIFSDESPKTQNEPVQIKKRERNNAHKMIEEFMVLANEEVAKWCTHHGLPFLSRIHGLPGNEQTKIIQEIISTPSPDKHIEKILSGSHQEKTKAVLKPSHIREFLESITDPKLLYRYSRLLLPKMAKANYSDLPFRHFGLALEYYSHFTSPIRRYPDLQVHRIIKEKLHQTLTNERIKHYKGILKKVARKCSEQERNAEEVERTMSGLYLCRYMQQHIGETFVGTVSGLSEFALFIELENGIETTLYLPHGKYFIDPIQGILTDAKRLKIAMIGDPLTVQVESINRSERRIVVIRK